MKTTKIVKLNKADLDALEYAAYILTTLSNETTMFSARDIRKLASKNFEDVNKPWIEVEYEEN